MQRNASAVGQGGLEQGEGTVSTKSGVPSESRHYFITLEVNLLT